MRTFAAIFLLVLFTTTQTPLGQLVKLPLLVKHFYKHQQQEGMSLAKFLNNHYTAVHTDADQAEDEQLPFKSWLSPSMSYALLPEAVKIDFALALVVPAKVILQEYYIPQQQLARIFHPPRV